MADLLSLPGPRYIHSGHLRWPGDYDFEARFFPLAASGRLGERWGGRRSSSGASVGAGASGFPGSWARLALRASIRSITWAWGSSGGAMVTDSPAILALMISWRRFLTASS